MYVPVTRPDLQTRLVTKERQKKADKRYQVQSLEEDLDDTHKSSRAVS